MSSYVGCWQITSSSDAPSLPCSSEGKDPHYTLYCMYVGTYVNLKHNTLIVINLYKFIIHQYPSQQFTAYIYCCLERLQKSGTPRCTSLQVYTSSGCVPNMNKAHITNAAKIPCVPSVLSSASVHGHQTSIDTRTLSTLPAAVSLQK